MQFDCAKHNPIKNQIAAIAQEIENVAKDIAQNSEKIPSTLKSYDAISATDLGHLAGKLIKFKSSADKRLNKFLQKLQQIDIKSPRLAQGAQQALDSALKRVSKLQTNHLAHLHYELEKLKILANAQEEEKKVDTIQGVAGSDPKKDLAAVLQAEKEAKANLGQCKKEMGELISRLPREGFDDVRIGLNAAAERLTVIEHNILQRLATKKVALEPSVESQIESTIMALELRYSETYEHIRQLLAQAGSARQDPGKTAQQLRDLSDTTRRDVTKDIAVLQAKKAELETLLQETLQLENPVRRASLTTRIITATVKVALALELQEKALADELRKLEKAAQSRKEQLQAAAVRSGEEDHHHHHHHRHHHRFHRHREESEIPTAPVVLPLVASIPASPLIPLGQGRSHQVLPQSPSGHEDRHQDLPLPLRTSPVSDHPVSSLSSAAASRKSSVEQRSIELSLLHKTDGWYMRYQDTTDTTSDTQPKPGEDASKQEKPLEAQEEKLKKAPEKIEPQELCQKLRDQRGSSPSAGLVGFAGSKLTAVDDSKINDTPPKIKLRIRAHSRQEALAIAKTLVQEACKRLTQEERSEEVVELSSPRL